MTTRTDTDTRFARSADGTDIAYEVTGSGPALVLVDGAMCQRAMGPSRGFARELAGHFTVYVYDRRGRGESGHGTSAYDVAREVEDLAAVIDAAGGVAHVFGVSSGAALALEASRNGVKIDRLVTFEAPFILDGTHNPTDPEFPRKVQALVDADRRGDAVKAFMRLVGVPAPFIWLMRVMPAWKQMTGIAHTLPHDLSIVVPFGQGRPLPAGHYDAVAPETLVMAGGKSPAYMRNAQAAIADALPNARLETLPGQTHMLKAGAAVPVITRFLAGPA